MTKLPYLRSYGLIPRTNRHSWLGRAIWHSMWIILTVLLAYFAYDEWDMAEQRDDARNDREILLRCVNGEAFGAKQADGTLEVLRCDAGTVILKRTVDGI